MATDTIQPRTRSRPATGSRRSTCRRSPGLLDGRYAEVRDLVRTNLATYASVLEDAERLGTDDFRDRVRDLVVEMAATGQTGMGFPTEYGGGGDIGASIAAFETLAFGDLSVLVKVGVQFGLFGGAILQLGTQRHHDAYLRDLITGTTMGCFAMTEVGHGSNVQALGTVGDVRPGDRGVRDHHARTRRRARTGSATPPAHAELAVVFAQLEVGGTRHGVHALRGAAAARRRGAARDHDRGRRPEDGPQRRRQRPDQRSTASGCRARTCSTSSPT